MLERYGAAGVKIAARLAFVLMLVLPAWNAHAAESVPSARTREASPHFDDRPVQLELIFGFGTTVGVLGLAMDYNVGEVLALGAGAGLGIHGPVWEAHARFRPWVARIGQQGRVLSALTLETAFSRGQYADFPDVFSTWLCEGEANRVGDGCFHADTVPRLTSFVQLELGWELRLPSGLMVRISGGAASALYMGTPHCVGAREQTVPCGGPEPERTIAVVTSALGYAF